MKTIKMMLVIATVAFFTSNSFADEHNIYAKDCSQLKKLHKRLLCKMGSDMYDSEISKSSATDESKKSLELKEKSKALKEKAEVFNEENKSLVDMIKNWGKKKD